MSTDRRRDYRKLAATIGGISAIPLAGCSQGDTSPEPLDDDETVDGDDGQGDLPSDATDTDDPSSPETPKGVDDRDDLEDTPDDADCDDDTVERLLEEQANLQNQLINLEHELRPLRNNARATKYLVEILESGFHADTLEQGRDVGLAARGSVVTLQILADGLPVGHGTAWFVDEGYLFTNAHNVDSGGQVADLRGITHEGDQFDIDVIDFDEAYLPDVALLRTAYRGPDPLPMAAVSDLAVGQPLVQVGHPGEVGYWITSMGRFVSERQSFTSDGDEYTGLNSVVPGRQGVSGSPVLTLDGEVVGMTWGGGPFGNRDPGEAAPVAPDYVFDSPIGSYVMSNHDGSDVLERKLEEWR